MLRSWQRFGKLFHHFLFSFIFWRCILFRNTQNCCLVNRSVLQIQLSWVISLIKAWMLQQKLSGRWRSLLYILFFFNTTPGILESSQIRLQCSDSSCSVLIIRKLLNGPFFIIYLFYICSSRRTWIMFPRNSSHCNRVPVCSLSKIINLLSWYGYSFFVMIMASQRYKL